MTRREFVTAWDVTCPTCGAGPREHCRNSLGAFRAGKWHIARARAASDQYRGA